MENNQKNIQILQEIAGGLSAGLYSIFLTQISTFNEVLINWEIECWKSIVKKWKR